MLRDIIQKTYINLVQATKLFFSNGWVGGVFIFEEGFIFSLDFLGGCSRGYSSWLWNRILSIEIVLSMASWHCGYSLFYLTDTIPHPTTIPSRRRQTRLSAQTRCYRWVYCFLTVFVLISTQTRKHSLPGTGTGVCVYLLTWEATSMISLLTESRASRRDLHVYGIWVAENNIIKC